MLPNIEGYTRSKSIWTGRTTYYRGGSGNPGADALGALFTLDTAGGRIVSMTILTPFLTIFSALWGSGLMGSRGGVIFGVLGFVAGLVLGFVLAQRFTQFLGLVIVGVMTWLVVYVIWSMLVHFWHADDPSYPSARLIRKDVMGEVLDCSQVDAARKGFHLFGFGRARLDTQHYICQRPELLRLEQQLNAAFAGLDQVEKRRREGAQGTLNTFRPLVFQCQSPDTRTSCIREAYDSLFGIIRMAEHPPV